MMQGLRAPPSDQTVLAVPGADLFGALLESNLELLRATRSLPFADGANLGDVRALCRREIKGFLGPRTPVAGPVLITGHQPEFCHPGVWAKNFLARGLAQRAGGAAFNLVADADACHQTMLGFPRWSGSPPRLRRDWLRVGKAMSGAPWQLTAGPNPSQQSSFYRELNRLQNTLGWTALGAEITQVQADGSRNSEPSDSSPVRANLGEWSSRLRQCAQVSLGLELPDLAQSAICLGEGFAWFAGEIFSRAGEFLTLHNRALKDFREQARIKNPGQPVPALEVRGDWIEAPFWIWRSDRFDGRKRVWFREHRGGEIALGDPHGGQVVSLGGMAFKKISSHLACHGLALRPRALTNTLFLRWFCCDWFIHGLGGAIYDQMTDRLGEAYYRHLAPHYGMVTATLRLPFAVEPAIDEAQLGQKIRRLWWNPSLWECNDPADDLLVAAYEKTRRNNARKKTRQILWDVHRQLQSCYAGLDEQRWQAKKANQSRALALSREWPWIFHPRERLSSLLGPLMDAKF